MANKKNRTESMQAANGKTFKVGDGVHWGFNGDRDPGTVLYVSDSGRQVFVSSDEWKITDGLKGFIEGDRGCDFTTVHRPIEECTCFTLRKDGRFTDHPRGGHAVHHGRAYARNPSF